MSLETLLRDAAQITNQSEPVGSVVASQDTTTRELLRHAQLSGDEIARRHDWGGLVVQFATNVPDSLYDAGTMTLPADFARMASGMSVTIDGAVIRGAASDGDIAIKRAAPSSSPPRYVYRGRVLEIAPRPARVLVAGLPVARALGVTYVSRNWIASTGGGASEWGANSDTTVFPEHLVLKSIVYRMRRQQGLPYQDEMAEFEADLEQAIAQDRGLRMARAQLPSIEAPG